MVVERLTKQPFAVVCRELVLEPLGMKGYFAEEPPRPPAWIGDEPGPRTGTPTEWHNSAHFRSLCLPASGLVTTAAGALALIRAFAGVPDDFPGPETRGDARSERRGRRQAQCGQRAAGIPIVSVGTGAGAARSP